MEMHVLAIIILIIVLVLDTITSFVALFNSIKNSRYIKDTLAKVNRNAYNIATHLKSHAEAEPEKPMSLEKPKKQPKAKDN